MLRVTLESLQEFRVSTSNYTADLVDRAPRRCRWSPRAAPTISTAPATGRIATPTGRATSTSSSAPSSQQGLPSKAPKLDKHSFGGALGGPIVRNRFFFFGNYEGLREESESPLLRNVPSPTLRDGVLVYVCADARRCAPAAPSRASPTAHSIPAGSYGLTPAEIASLDPLGIGPSRAVSDHFKKYPMPNDPGRDGINYMGFRFAAPIENQFKTYTTRLDFRVDDGGNHRMFFRGVKQDDEINGTPQFPGQAASTSRDERELRLRHRLRLRVSQNIVNTFRYGLSKIDEATLGLQDGERRHLPLHHDFDALTSTNAREVPLTTSSTTSRGCAAATR